MTLPLALLAAFVKVGLSPRSARITQCKANELRREDLVAYVYGKNPNTKAKMRLDSVNERREECLSKFKAGVLSGKSLVAVRRK